MRGTRFALFGAAALMLSATASIHAVYNGAADGTTHPAVGFFVGTKGADPCDPGGQAIGCSGVLIAPDLMLSTAECTDAIRDSIATGFIDDGWVILDANPLATTTPPATLDCTKFVHIDSYDVNPEYTSSFGAQGDVGVMILAQAQSITPATLPPARRLKPKPAKRLPDITAVSFGELANPASPGGFDIFTLARRSAHATFGSIGAETHETILDPAAGDDPCIGFLSRGGPNFVTGADEVVSLAKYPSTTCDTTALFQRLDTTGVRAFLSGYVALP